MSLKLMIENCPFCEKKMEIGRDYAMTTWIWNCQDACFFSNIDMKDIKVGIPGPKNLLPLMRLCDFRS